jgi:hypothetical protein
MDEDTKRFLRLSFVRTLPTPGLNQQSPSICMEKLPPLASLYFWLSAILLHLFDRLLVSLESIIYCWNDHTRSQHLLGALSTTTLSQRSIVQADAQQNPMIGSF